MKNKTLPFIIGVVRATHSNAEASEHSLELGRQIGKWAQAGGTASGKTSVCKRIMEQLRAEFQVPPCMLVEAWHM